MADDARRWLVDPARFRLADVDPGSTDGSPPAKAARKEAAAALRRELTELQERLYAEATRSLLLVLQAMDAGGKDGTIRNVFAGVNPQGCQVTSFKVPTEEERAHDFLWRVHRAVPRHGMIGVFNRSHYEDVLVVRVHGLVEESVWRDRYASIRDFESLLTSSGTTVVKVMLHISKDEQAKRLRKRLDNPEKHWKFNRGDLEERARWDGYMAAFDDALQETSTDSAPWYCVPADDKSHRDVAVLTILVDTLRRLAPQFPEPEAGLDAVVVE